MSLHSRSHSHGPSQDNNTPTASAVPSTNNHPASQLVQAAQTLTSIGAPNLRIQTANSSSHPSSNILNNSVVGMCHFL